MRVNTKSITFRRSQILFVWIAAIFWSIAVLACGGGSGGGDGDGDRLRIESLPPVVFLADKQTEGTDELYVSFDGGAVIRKLSGPMTTDGNVVDFAVSPNGQYVAYVADQLTDGVFELFVATIDGGTAPTTPASGAMAGDGIAEISAENRYAFAWSPDSQRIAYRAAQSTASVVELFTVLPNGAQNEKLHPNFAAGQNVDAFAWAPDGSRVAYIANQSPPPPSTAAVELYTSLPTGLDNDRVSDNLVAGGNVTDFAWSPNSDRIAYRADQTTVDKFELFVTLPDQQAAVPVSFPLLDDGDVRRDFAWAPDGSRLAYRADLVDDVQYGTQKLGLFTNTPAGTSGVRASGGIVPANASGVVAFQWSPDSTLLIYVADQNLQGQLDLFVAEPASAVPVFVRVSEFSAAGGEVTDAAWSSDSLRIAYIADQNDLNRVELFSGFRTGAGVPQPVSDLGDPDSDVAEFAWSPDIELIAFRADQDIDGVIELYTAPPTGAVNNTVSDAAATGGQVQQFLWNFLGDGIGYIADQDIAGQFELYLSLADGSAGMKVSGPLVSGGDVLRFAWVP